MGAEKTIQMHHLPVTLQTEIQCLTTGPLHIAKTDIGGELQRRTFSVLPEKVPLKKKNLAQRKKEQEVASIVAALIDTRGNAAQAARMIGISPQLINYKLKRYGIDRHNYR